jgi:hypothetical protein
VTRVLAIALAGVCAFMPSFAPGAVCTSANEAVECRCSECISWDAGIPDVTHAAATSYEIHRLDPDGTLHVQTITRTPSYDDAGNLAGYDPPRTTWCPAKHDESMPLEGRTYRYTVRACAGGVCEVPSAEHVYVAAPYATTFRPPVKAN